MFSHTFLFLCKKLFNSIFSLSSVKFGSLTIFDQASFVKSIKSWQGEHVFVVSSLKGKNFGKGGMW